MEAMYLLYTGNTQPLPTIKLAARLLQICSIFSSLHRLVKLILLVNVHLTETIAQTSYWLVLKSITGLN